MSKRFWLLAVMGLLYVIVVTHLIYELIEDAEDGAIDLRIARPQWPPFK